MDGIQAEITTALNAFSENEFEKMLAETEQVLDRAGHFPESKDADADITTVWTDECSQLWCGWQSYVGDNWKVSVDYDVEIDISNGHNMRVTNIQLSPTCITNCLTTKLLLSTFLMNFLFQGYGNKSWYLRLQLTSRLSLLKYFNCHQCINKLNKYNSEDLNINAMYDLGCRRTITGLMT